jgi:hypothetical protein
VDLVFAAVILIVCGAVWNKWKEHRPAAAPAERPLFKFSDEYDEPSSEPIEADVGLSDAERLQGLVDAAVSEAEIQNAVAHLRLVRKALHLARRKVTLDQRMVRARETHRVRQRLPMYRGGAQLGHDIRTVQTIARYATRYELAATLEPGTMTIDEIDRGVLELDWSILALERKLFDLKAVG